METIWFCLVAILIAGYVIFDGFDLGVGAIHMFVGRTEKEREAIISTVGPVWDGNEVWLIAGGGTLYFAFPSLYASSFSGFYLALMIVLWLLILRGIALEFRNHIHDEIWKPLWDVVFAWSSGLLALVFGVALGNVVRGVPIDANGYFFLPLWTDLRPGAQPGVLDWYTLLIGITSLAALSMHGALWLVLKSDGEIRRRASQWVRRAWPAVVLLGVLITVASFAMQPHLAAQYSSHPWGCVFPILAVAGLAGIFFYHRAGREIHAFLSSCAYLAGMLLSVVFGLYPIVLPSNADPTRSLTIHNAAAPEYGLRIGLWWFIPGMILVAGYFLFAYRHQAGKVKVS
ncbi:MAG TPA: cytochrome d ubiquinol oxidase subunit II [Bryobacteraceae bacterium]|jgi:cytochrome d ubiquinol oxidase subunit II|nr:cytochrome d ubiquinol oxidase subunit II [Bryobacteraceae bacterium]